jgi:hypothetical protein
MKKLILSLLGVALIATLIYAESTQQKNTGAGLQIGTSATQKIGFFGATPVVQQTAVTNAPAVLATLTLSKVTFTNVFADTTNVISAVTNVTINSIAGPPSTNTVNGIINALRNLGLAGN